ncbi:unnamed protein product [Peniophora sp. CBMAI 1063]|nr:unnamed protein product [Peniophora sp. CBMAI 1063]
MPRFEPGFSAANIEGVAAYLKKLDYNGPLAFGWDDTELQQGVTVMQQTPEFCVVVGGAAGPVEVRNEGDIESMVRALDPKTKLATKMRAWLIAIPLIGIPPILVALSAREGNVSAGQLFAMHQKLIDLMHVHGIHPVLLSSDGTETERSLQRMIHDSATDYFEFKINGPAILDGLKVTASLWKFPLNASKQIHNSLLALQLDCQGSI